MNISSYLLTLNYFSRAYFFAATILVLFYLIRNFSFHTRFWRAARQNNMISTQLYEHAQIHCASLRQAEHVALGLGRAMFASQLSGLLLYFTPMLRATDSRPWLSVPEFLITCQLCFLPVLILLFLDWSLSAHLRRFTLPH
jgi:hypothetical protein